MEDVIAAVRQEVTGRAEAGRSYVVFGQTATSAIDLLAIAAGTGKKPKPFMRAKVFTSDAVWQSKKKAGARR